MQGVHHVTKNSSLRTTTGKGAFFQFILKGDGLRGAYDNDVNVILIFHRCDAVFSAQNPLIDQITNRQHLRVVTNRHGGYDFGLIQINRQWAFNNDARLLFLAVLIHAFDNPGEPWVSGIWAQNHLR